MPLAVSDSLSETMSVRPQELLPGTNDDESEGEAVTASGEVDEGSGDAQQQSVGASPGSSSSNRAGTQSSRKRRYVSIP